MHNQLVTAFSFLGLASGALAAGLILSKRGSNLTVASALLCTISGASAFTLLLVQPLAVLWESVFFFFLPLFIPPFVGTLIAYWRKEELKSPTK